MKKAISIFILVFIITPIIICVYQLNHNNDVAPPQSYTYSNNTSHPSSYTYSNNTSHSSNYTYSHTNKSIVGKWTDESSQYKRTYVFNEDGSGSVTIMYSYPDVETFNYSVKGNTLTVWDSTDRIDVTFNISDNTLTMDGTTFTRQTN